MLNYIEHYNCLIEAKTEMAWQFFEKFSDIKFQENVLISFQVFHLYKETARQMDWVNLMGTPIGLWPYQKKREVGTR
jgi:hypothetical protein